MIPAWRVAVCRRVITWPILTKSSTSVLVKYAGRHWKIESLKGKIFGDKAKSISFTMRWCVSATAPSSCQTLCRSRRLAAATEPAKRTLCMAESWIDYGTRPAPIEGLQATILYQLMLSADAQQHGQSIGRIDKYTGHLFAKGAGRRHHYLGAGTGIHRCLYSPLKRYYFSARLFH